ncbi:MAG: hypothetical protein ACPGWR_31340 [Ardenticatenaceae bacterium]
MIRKFYYYYKWPDEFSFQAVMKVFIRRLVLFLAVVMACFLLAGLYLLLKDGLIWVVFALFVLICLIIAIIMNEKSKRIGRPILRAILQIIGGVWSAYEIGRLVQSQISWGPNTFFWTFWVSFLSMVALGIYALDSYSQKMRQSKSLDTNEPPMKGSA